MGPVQERRGARSARFAFPEPTREFQVEVDLVAEMTIINPFDFFIEDSCQKVPFEYPRELGGELKPFLSQQGVLAA